MEDIVKNVKEEDSQRLTLKRKRIMIYFVEATRKLIQTEGVDGLSIRKIASEAGYNSATIYNYFQNLEHLALFGSVCYMRDYVVKLSGALTPDMNALERYRTIYRCFNDLAFEYPDIFHNLFFGRYSAMLGDVLHTYYYDLFPEELDGISTSMREMLVAGSMKERDRITMNAMIEEGFVAPEKADMTLELMISLHQHYIYEATMRGSEEARACRERFDQVFEYVMKMAR